MGSIKDPELIDELLNMLQAGSRGNPPPEKVRKAIDPETNKYPSGTGADEYITRMLMNDEAVHGPDGIELSNDTQHLGPENLTMDETRVLRSLKGRKGSKAPTAKSAKKNFGDRHDGNSKTGYSGRKASNDLLYGQGMEKVTELRKDPRRLREYMRKMSHFGDGNFDDMNSKDLAHMFGITKSQANKLMPTLKEVLGGNNAIYDQILQYVED